MSTEEISPVSSIERSEGLTLAEIQELEKALPFHPEIGLLFGDQGERLPLDQVLEKCAVATEYPNLLVAAALLDEGGPEAIIDQVVKEGTSFEAGVMTIGTALWLSEAKGEPLSDAASQLARVYKEEAKRFKGVVDSYEEEGIPVEEFELIAQGCQVAAKMVRLSIGIKVNITLSEQKEKIHELSHLREVADSLGEEESDLAALLEDAENWQGREAELVAQARPWFEKVVQAHLDWMKEQEGLDDYHQTLEQIRSEGFRAYLENLRSEGQSWYGVLEKWQEEVRNAKNACDQIEVGITFSQDHGLALLAQMIIDQQDHGVGNLDGFDTDSVQGVIDQRVFQESVYVLDRIKKHCAGRIS